MDDNTHNGPGYRVDVLDWWCLCGLPPGWCFDLLWWAR